MTFWSGNKIAEEFGAPANIVRPFDRSRIDCSAYTLTLGEQYFITPDHDMNLRESVRKSLVAPVPNGLNGAQGASSGGPMSIPAGQFAFLLTEEFLEMPDNVMGFISMRAGYKLKGLINVSGFHVDPGFRGKLVFAVYNAGPSTVHLARGEGLFLLWLADLDFSATDQYSRKRKDPLFEIKNDIITGVNHPIHSLQNLSKKIVELERDTSTKITELENSFKLLRNSAYIIAASIAVAASVVKFWPVSEKAVQAKTITNQPSASVSKVTETPSNIKKAEVTVTK